MGKCLFHDMLYNGSVTRLTALHEGILKPPIKLEGRWMKMTHWALWNHMQKKVTCTFLPQIILISSSLVSVSDCTVMYLNSWGICACAWVGAGAVCPRQGVCVLCCSWGCSGCGSRAPPEWKEHLFITHISTEAPWQWENLKNIPGWMFFCTALCS